MAFPTNTTANDNNYVESSFMDSTIEKEVAPAGESSYTVDILSYARTMFENAGEGTHPVPNYDVMVTSTSAQVLNYEFTWKNNMKQELIIKFAPNIRPETLRETIVLKLRSLNTYPDPTNINKHYRIVGTLSIKCTQQPTTVYTIGTINGEKLTEEIYNGAGYNRKISYFDKTNKLLQEINLAASPSGKDVIKFREYDCMGRADSIEYLPYTLASTGGARRTNPQAEQKTFYQSLFPSPDDYNYAYTSKIYDKSPSSAVLFEKGPGREYHITTESGSHFTTYYYSQNATNEVYKYVIGASGTVSASQKYSVGSLNKIHSAFDVSADNRMMTIEYKDASGKLIAKSVSGTNEAARSTYYVYDDMDRLRYIVPDVVHRQIKDVKAFHSPEAYRKYWYYYEYDEQGRVIKAIKPGKADEYFVYDKKGNLVMSQDGNLRADKRWMYHSYDALGRETGSMLITDTGSTPLSRAQIQTLFNNDSFPGVGSESRFKQYILLESKSYDRYEGFSGEPCTPVSGIATADMLAPSNIGRLLYELAFLLPYDGTDQLRGLTSRTYYYDKKGRPLQTVEYDSYTSTTSRYTNKYDAVGNVVATVETHSDGTTTNTKRTDYTFDNFGRLLAEKTTVNTSEPVTTTYTYDELGNMASKTLGSSGITETYTYNLQGMMTSQDSKRMKMEYTYDTEVDGYANEPRYDGNLSMVEWQYKTTSPKDEAYVYDYDKWGQLAEGQYFSAGTAAGIYDENAQYDANGNITRMLRTGSSADWNTDYNYVYNGNQISSINYTERSRTGTYNFSHDANGNMTNNPRRGWNYLYNHLNLLSHIVDPDAGMMAYYMWLADGTKYGAYDVAGNATRIYKGSFTYTGTREADAESVSFSGGEFLASGTGAAKQFTPTYVITDRLGSPRVVVNSKGSTIVRNSYYPFGLTHYDYLYTDQLVRTNRYHFNGKEKQTFSTLIDYHLLDYGARMYDPYLCRWITPDPADQLLNPYVFCANDPVKYIDPDGEWFFSLIFPGVGTIIDAVLWTTTGAYLGGVAANDKQWNPGKWDWQSKKTWGGLLGGAVQGALTGGAFWYAMQPLMAASKIYEGAKLFGKIVNWTQTGAFAASVLTSTASMLTHSRTASDIILGQFYYDGSKSVGHQIWQAFSRRTWESMQQWLGYNIAQVRNTFGGIDNVQFAGGAVLANHNNPSTRDEWGLTLGNTINGMNMDVSKEIFTHEYGHTLQGRRWGPLYFLMIAPSSGLSCLGDEHHHSRRWYERQATLLGYQKFRREPDWPNYDYPFNKY